MLVLMTCTMYCILSTFTALRSMKCVLPLLKSELYYTKKWYDLSSLREKFKNALGPCSRKRNFCQVCTTVALTQNYVLSLVAGVFVQYGDLLASLLKSSQEAKTLFSKKNDNHSGFFLVIDTAFRTKVLANKQMLRFVAFDCS